MHHRSTLSSYLAPLIIGLSFINQAAAINPVSGWYGGVFLGPSYAPNSDFTLSIPNYLSPQKGTLSYSVLGNVGGEVVYRFCDRYRLEGELFYNNAPYSEITFSSLTPANQAQILSVFPRVTFPNNGFSIQSSTTASGLTMQGQTNTVAFMLNGYYDFLSHSQDNYSNIAPYVGVGVGYVYVQNNINYYVDGTQLDRFQITNAFETAAAQAIVGSSYFLDDFTTLSLDARYFSSAKTSQTGNFGFNTFIDRDTFYSVNIVFNGAFDGG